jgi:hypothetical protein
MCSGWNISIRRPTHKNTPEPPATHTYNAKDPWRTQSVSISQQPNVTALPSRQCSTQKHTQERRRKGKCCSRWLLFIYMCRSGASACMCVRDMKYGGCRWLTLENGTFLTPSKRNLLKLFRHKYNFTSTVSIIH